MSDRISDQAPTAKPAGRLGQEGPAAIARDGWRYHHIGIPTTVPRAGERYLPAFKLYISGFSSSPYGIEWMRFEPDAPLPEIIKTTPHIAFAVDDLAAALEGKDILVAPNSPAAGIKVAMILDDGAPVELLEFTSMEELPTKQGA
jgi:hypothetical protein